MNNSWFWQVSKVVRIGEQILVQLTVEKNRAIGKTNGEMGQSICKGNAGDRMRAIAMLNLD